MPEGVTEIGEGAFANCRALEKIKLPKSLSRLGEKAFASCPSLREAEMPEEIAEIGGGLFDGCRALADEEGFVIIDGVCYGCQRTAFELVLPAGVRAVASGAFRDGAGYRGVTLPESVERAGVRAFAGCAELRRLVLPEKVKALGPEPFAGCSSLLVVEAPGIAPRGFDEERARLAAALGFCGAEERYRGGVARSYSVYAEEEKENLLNAAIDNGLADAAAYFTRRALLSAAEFRAALERAQRKKEAEIVALLLAYGNDKLRGEDIFAKYSLDD